MMVTIDGSVDYEPYRFGDPAVRLAGGASEVGSESASILEAPFPFVAASVEVGCCVAGRGAEVEGDDSVLIDVCRSARSCCRARLNLSSLSNFVSSCRFSFSINLNFIERKRLSFQQRERERSVSVPLHSPCVGSVRRSPTDDENHCVPSPIS